VSGTASVAVVSADRTIPAEYAGKIEPNYYCRAWNTKRGKYCRSRAGHGTAHVGVGRCKVHGGHKKDGDARVTGARYSAVNSERLGELIAEHMADGDPLNMLPDIAAARAIFQDYIERHGPITAALLAWHDTWEGRYHPLGDTERKALVDAVDELEALLLEPDDEQAAMLELARSAIAFLTTPQNPKPRRIMDISEAVGHLDVISKMVARVEQARSSNAISRPELLRVMTEMGRVVQAHVTDPTVLANIRDGWLSVRL
jgi:hypothetical protein